MVVQSIAEVECLQAEVKHFRKPPTTSHNAAKPPRVIRNGICPMSARHVCRARSLVTQGAGPPRMSPRYGDRSTSRPLLIAAQICARGSTRVVRRQVVELPVIHPETPPLRGGESACRGAGGGSPRKVGGVKAPSTATERAQRASLLICLTVSPPNCHGPSETRTNRLTDST
jgi:hypothetical protein